MALPVDETTAEAAWRDARKNLGQVKRQLERFRAKIVDRTINSSDLLDGLWAADNALPRWEQHIDEALADVDAAALTTHVRAVHGDNSLDPAADWTALKAAFKTLVDAIAADANLFNSDGSENKTIEVSKGARRAKVYAGGEMDYLVPLIDGCMQHLD